MSEMVGELLRQARVQRKLSQRDVGKRVGYSTSWVSRVESGKITPSGQALAVLCDLLEVPVSRLGNEGEAVHRRKMLTLGLGVGVGAALPGSSASAHETANVVERALFHLPESRPIPLAELPNALAKARSLHQSARYGELGQMLPRLISSSLSAGARDVSARSYVLLTQLAIKNYQGFSWVAADRARSEAQASGNPVVMGEAAHAMAVVMRRAGEYGVAEAHLQEAVNRLGEEPDGLALKGNLLLTASYTAAQAGNKTRALDLVGEAEETAKRKETADRRLYIPGIFGVSQTLLYRVSIHRVLGDVDRALGYAERIDPLRLPNPERRARLCLDVARTWRDAGEPERAFCALHALEQHAPEEARRSQVRLITNGLLALNGEVPGLRQFAHRIGAVG